MKNKFEASMHIIKARELLSVEFYGIIPLTG